MSVLLSLLETDMLAELERAPMPSVTAPQLALACNIELPKAISVLNGLRRLGLASVYVSGIATETRWKITEPGRRELTHSAQLTLVPLEQVRAALGVSNA